jgi:gas vesicle protein
MTRGTDRLSDAATTVRPYVERALRDEELRDDLRQAFRAARDVYEELVAQGHVSKAASRVATDRDVQDNLRNAIEDLRSATRRLQGREEEYHRARSTMLLFTGVALGVLFNPVTGPQTRAWLREVIFGPAEEFEYQAPAEEPGASDDGSA